VGEQLVGVSLADDADDRGPHRAVPADHDGGPARQVRDAERAEERLVDDDGRRQAVPVGGGLVLSCTGGSAR
jgi:hypothetical protein